MLSSTSAKSADTSVISDTNDGSKIPPNGPVTLPSPDGTQRDAVIWFEDGNIIVIAQSTAFRFHKSVISFHSKVFCELFSVPQPSNAGEAETFDGCAVMRVSDTSYDFRQLLRAIYHGVSYLHPTKTITFPILAALARLGHKYQLDQLLEAVIYRLQRTFTTDLAVWDQSRGFSAESPLKLIPDDAIEALNLFRLLERPEMIPTALWGCCRLAPSVLIHGAERADGVTRERLELADLELCWEVQRQLVQETVELMTRMCAHIIARMSETKCQKRDKCIEGLRVFLQGMRTCMPTLAFVDPLDGFNPLLKVNPSPISTLMCTICVNSLKEKHTELRKIVWQKLPEIMGMTIEGWGPQGAT